MCLMAVEYLVIFVPIMISTITLPCNKDNLAFLDIFLGNEIKIKDSIAALISRQRGGEIIVTFIWASEFLHHHLLLINFEDNETVVSFCF